MENPFMLLFYSALKGDRLFKSTKKIKPFIYDFEGQAASHSCGQRLPVLL